MHNLQFMFPVNQNKKINVFSEAEYKKLALSAKI